MDPQAYLIQQGWSGPGNPLNPSRRPGAHGGLGLTKPILVSRKRNTHGVGKKTTHDHTNQWWLRGFETALRGIGDDVSATPVSDESTAVGGGGPSELYKFFVRGQGLAGTIEKRAVEAAGAQPVVDGSEESKGKKKKRKRDSKEDGEEDRRSLEKEEKRERKRKRKAEKELRLADEAGKESTKKQKKKEKEECTDDTEAQDELSGPKVAEEDSDRKKKKKKRRRDSDEETPDMDEAERKREKKLKKAAKKAARDSTSKSDRKSKKEKKSKKKEKHDES